LPGPPPGFAIDLSEVVVVVDWAGAEMIGRFDTATSLSGWPPLGGGIDGVDI
jgi:hypothetical protein